MATIPASQIVTVNPEVISAGGNPLVLNGLMLTTGTRVPIGSILSFPTAAAVTAYFGGNSAEASVANIYFLGFDNSNIKPGSILFAQYNEAAVSGYLRGGSLATLTLTQLQALSGTLTITFAGSALTSTTISLAAATSFSNAATIIHAAFTTPSFSVTYDSIASAFVFTSTATGALETITYATGTLAADLALTQATGAVLSQGAAATTPTALMNSIAAQNQNWATFMTVQNPDVSGNTLKLEFAAWANAQNDRYMYVCWDTDITPTQSTTATTSLGYILTTTNSSGTVPIYGPDNTKAAFICGATASIDFTETNGRITFAFKSQSGLTADVTDPTIASNLIANGYNFYGSYATANQGFNFFYPGSVTGIFKWADSFINQIWLNNAFQLALMTMLTQNKSVPYDNLGYGLQRAALLDPINAAGVFGVYGPGIPLSALQAAEVNAAAGVAIDKNLSAQGYYLQILPATAQTRGLRASNPITFWYLDVGSVQKISMSSVEIQ